MHILGLDPLARCCTENALGFHVHLGGGDHDGADWGKSDQNMRLVSWASSRRGNR